MSNTTIININDSYSDHNVNYQKQQQTLNNNTNYI